MSTYTYQRSGGGEASGEFWALGPTGIRNHSGCKWVLSGEPARCVLIGRRSSGKYWEIASVAPGQSIEISDGGAVCIIG